MAPRRRRQPSGGASSPAMLDRREAFSQRQQRQQERQLPFMLQRAATSRTCQAGQPAVSARGTGSLLGRILVCRHHGTTEPYLESLVCLPEGTEGAGVVTGCPTAGRSDQCREAWGEGLTSHLNRYRETSRVHGWGDQHMISDRGADRARRQGGRLHESASCPPRQPWGMGAGGEGSARPNMAS